MLTVAMAEPLDCYACDEDELRMIATGREDVPHFRNVSASGISMNKCLVDDA